MDINFKPKFCSLLKFIYTILQARNRMIEIYILSKLTFNTFRDYRNTKCS